MLEPGLIPLVLFVSNFEVGGTERQMVELVTRLDRTRFAPHVACFSAAGPLSSLVAAAGLPVATFPITGGFARPATWSQMLRFGRWCTERRIAILQTSDFYTNIFALPGAALARVPVRIGGRRELKTEKTVAKLLLQRAAYAAAHMIVANSAAAAARLGAERVAPRRVAVVPNGLDASVFSTRPVTRVRRIVTVANLRPEKAHDVLLAAAADVVALRPDVEFIIAGGGPLREQIEADVRRRGLARHVRLLGHCDDVRGVLAAADLFVLPSRSEAFPNAVLEAMAAGVPVVTTAVGGLLELIEQDRTGMLVPVDDPRALAAAILGLVANPARANALAAEARRTAERYSFTRMVDAFEALYLDQLARRREHRSARLQPARP
jgi:glycosyltransferase involved in cell wall biosynthesis